MSGRLIICLGLLAALNDTAVAAPQECGDRWIQWPQPEYNPAPADDDFVLPMPCHGAMVFRRIEVPSRNRLDDFELHLGDTTGDRSAIIGGVTVDHLAGQFPGSGKPRRHYFMGKYEVTEAQFAAATAHAESGCRKTRNGAMPKTKVGWIDAMQAATSYSKWLGTKAQACVPRNGDYRAFVRLPTEAEWEFAARGGMRVEPTEFSAARFPMPDGSAQQYIWFAGPRSSGGRLNPVGLLKPNPLGLHDILGNVSEFVFDLFALRVDGRSHGQPGGYVVKGGAFDNDLNAIRSGARDEVHPIGRSGSGGGQGTVGFRLVLAIPVLSSNRTADDLHRELARRDALSSDEKAGALERRALENLEKIEQHVGADPLIRKSTEDTRVSLQVALDQRREARERAVREQMKTGVFISELIETQEIASAFNQRKLSKLRDTTNKIASIVEKSGRGHADLQRATSALADAKATVDGMGKRLSETYKVYSETLKSIREAFSEGDILEQLKLLKDAAIVRGDYRFDQSLDCFAEDLQLYKPGTDVTRSHCIGTQGERK